MVPPKGDEPGKERIRQGVGAILFSVAIIIFIIFLGSAEALIDYLNALLKRNT